MDIIISTSLSWDACLYFICEYQEIISSIKLYCESSFWMYHSGFVFISIYKALGVHSYLIANMLQF